MMRAPPLQYFKRFQMDIDLRRWRPPAAFVPARYCLRAWSPRLLRTHAEVKFISFRDEMDAVVFPCLGELRRCQRLMEDIAGREGFLTGATWLAEYRGDSRRKPHACGTIQAIRTARQRACIQNVGVTPPHRGQGVGTALITASLTGMQAAGVAVATLEVTADNASAVQLYRRIGFRTVKTLYKSLDESLSALSQRDR